MTNEIVPYEHKIEVHQGLNPNLKPTHVITGMYQTEKGIEMKARHYHAKDEQEAIRLAKIDGLGSGGAVETFHGEPVKCNLYEALKNNISSIVEVEIVKVEIIKD